MDAGRASSTLSGEASSGVEETPFLTGLLWTSTQSSLVGIQIQELGRPQSSSSALNQRPFTAQRSSTLRCIVRTVRNAAVGEIDIASVRCLARTYTVCGVLGLALEASTNSETRR